MRASERKDFEFSGLQIMLLHAIFVGFIVSTHRMLPLFNLPKTFLILCALGTVCFAFLVFLFAILFAIYLGQFKHINSSWLAILITAVLFLLIPVTANIVINTAYPICERQYLQSIPSDNQILVRVTYDIERVDGYGSVGNEWKVQHFFKSITNTEFQSGDIISVHIYAPFSILSRFTEIDSINDIGETKSKTYKYSENDNYKRTLTISQYVHIEENGGRKNAGAFVDYKVNYVLERVIPDSMGFWDIISINDVERTRCVHWIWGELFCIAVILFVVLRGISLQKKQHIEDAKQAQLEAEKLRIEVERQKQLEAEQRRIAEEKRRAEIEYQNQLKAERQRIAEEKRRAEHDELVAKYSNKTRTQIAIECGMPSEFCMGDDDLPHSDDSDKSYLNLSDKCTVYLSTTGKVYHAHPACNRAAQHPVNITLVPPQRRPCMKCSPIVIDLQWYKRYRVTMRMLWKHSIEPLPQPELQEAFKQTHTEVTLNHTNKH